MTTLVKAKCLDCSLHFIVCTEMPKKWEDKKIHCPECGNTNDKIVWTEETTMPIFTIVPGSAKLHTLP